jgi:hypothetical protein
MQFRLPDNIIFQTDESRTLQFAPAPRTVLSTQSTDVADRTIFGNRFDSVNCSDDFKSRTHATTNWRTHATTTKSLSIWIDGKDLSCDAAINYRDIADKEAKISSIFLPF